MEGTKNALETGCTFATLFADMELRQRFLSVHSEDEFKKLLWEHTKELAEEQSNTKASKCQSTEDIKVCHSGFYHHASYFESYNVGYSHRHQRAG